MNLRKDHYRIDRVVFASATTTAVTTRVARWGAPVDENVVSERPRLTVSRLERARRRSTVDFTNGFGGHALPVLASGYLSRPPLRRSFGRPVLCSRVRRRPRLLRRVVGGRARAPIADGESTGGRRASATPRVSAGVVRRRPLRGSKSRSSSSRPPKIGLARVLLPITRLRDGRPPGRRFSVTVSPVHHSYWYVSLNALGPRVRTHRRLRTTNR